MLAALGVSAAGCKPRTKGIQPDQPNDVNQQSQEQQTPQQIGVAGIMPDDRQDSNQITRGIRPDKPPKIYSDQVNN